MKKFSPVQIALLIYAFVIPFQRIIFSSWFLHKFQIPEIVFLVLLILSTFHAKPKIKFHFSFLPIILFTAWSIVSISFHYSKSSLLEGVGLLYLFILGAITAWVVSISDRVFLNWLIKAFILGIAINCFFAVVGFLFLYNGIENGWGREYVDYPIIGTVYRMEGFTSHPIMLSNLAICALLLSLAVFEKNRKFILSLLLIGIGLSLTKSILSGLAAMIIVYHDKIATRFRISSTLILILVISILFVKEYLTHFTIPITDQQADKLSNTLYWGGDIKIPINKDYSIFNTVYFQLKGSSFEAFLEHPMTGVGGGSSNAYNLEKVNAGLLPETVKKFDPHSSVLGILAEFGIIGFSLIVLSFIFLFKILHRLLKEGDTKLVLSLLAAFLFIVFESFSADVLNYRHLWLLGGIVYGIYFSSLVSANAQRPAEFYLDNR